MDKVEAVRKMFPGKEQMVDFEYRDDMDGKGPYFARWNINAPVPTDADLQPHWIDFLKDQKNAELLSKRDTTLTSQFTSTNAAGTTHTFYWDTTSQMKFHGQITLLNLDSTITTVDWLTVDAGMVTHQRADFIKAFQDSGAFERSQHNKYYNLKSQVDAVTNTDPAAESKINAITW